MGLDSNQHVKETSYTQSAKAISCACTELDLEQNQKLIETNKRSNIILGSSQVANFKPSEAKQAFTKPEHNPDNRSEAMALKQNFKKPNFSVAEHGQAHIYYDTSANNNAILQTKAKRPDQGLINDRRLDARASHFKVGFEPGVVAPMQGSKAQTNVQANDSSAADANKKKMAACNVSMGTSKEESKGYMNSQMKTSN